MLIRAAVLLGCLGLAAGAAQAQAPNLDCASDMRVVREALARDQNLSEDGRRSVEQLLRDAQQALSAGDQVVCREMMEDARELLGLDAAD